MADDEDGEGGEDQSDDDDDEAEEAKNEDDKLLEEMQELQAGIDARTRRDKKKKAKIKAKERMRTALGLQGQDAEGAATQEMDLFSLARIKSKVRERALLLIPAFPSFSFNPPPSPKKTSLARWCECDISAYDDNLQQKPPREEVISPLCDASTLT